MVHKGEKWQHTMKRGSATVLYEHKTTQNQKQTHIGKCRQRKIAALGKNKIFIHIKHNAFDRSAAFEKLD